MDVSIKDMLELTTAVIGLVIAIITLIAAIKSSK